LTIDNADLRKPLYLAILALLAIFPGSHPNPSASSFCPEIIFYKNMELEAVNELISDLKIKIKVEQKVKEGAEGMLQALSNPESKLSCQDSIQEAKKRLDFLGAEMMKLQVLRKELHSVEIEPDLQVSSASLTSLSNETYPRKYSSKFSGMLKRFTLSRRQSDSSINSIGISMPELNQVPATSTFGYIRSDTTITRDKVQYLIREIQRKLEIEKRVKDGTLRMLESNSNLKSKRDLEVKYNESESKIQILGKSLQNYHSINLGQDGNLKVLENDHHVEGTGQLIVK
jgi:Hr1 repeat